MAVKTFNPQPTGNQAIDSNFKQLAEIINAIIIELQNLKK
jgi:hemerythrin